jgi:hypothetical protein
MLDEMNASSQSALVLDRPSFPGHEKISIPQNKTANLVTRGKDAVEVIELTSDESDDDDLRLRPANETLLITDSHKFDSQPSPPNITPDELFAPSRSAKRKRNSDTSSPFFADSSSSSKKSSSADERALNPGFPKTSNVLLDLCVDHSSPTIAEPSFELPKKLKGKTKRKGKGKETEKITKAHDEDEPVGRVKKNKKNRVIFDSDGSDGTHSERGERVAVSSETLPATTDDADGKKTTKSTVRSPENVANEHEDARQAPGKQAARTKVRSILFLPGDHPNSLFVHQENIVPDVHITANPALTPVVKHVNRPHSIGRKSTPMSELIRRVNSYPNSPFPAGPSAKIQMPSLSTATAYSPLLKSSRSLLSQIAPLHPNRRTPPPPLPKPPPLKKSKKQLALEEKWEEELSETVEGWAALSDGERAELRKAKWELEMGECD